MSSVLAEWKENNKWNQRNDLKINKIHENSKRTNIQQRKFSILHSQKMKKAKIALQRKAYRKGMEKKRVKWCDEKNQWLGKNKITQHTEKHSDPKIWK